MKTCCVEAAELALCPISPSLRTFLCGRMVERCDLWPGVTH